MKKLIFLIFLLLICNFSFAQTLANYFYNQGVKDLCTVSHVTNDYVTGQYSVAESYIEVGINSKDNLFGRDIYTQVRVIRGFGDLYFRDLIVESDNDTVNPFDGFGLMSNALVKLVKNSDPDNYAKIKRQIAGLFDEPDPERWTGKMWALVYINLEYYDYLGNH